MFFDGSATARPPFVFLGDSSESAQIRPAFIRRSPRRLHLLIFQVIRGLKRYLVETGVARRMTGAAVRGFLDAENALQLAAWPYPSSARDVPIELSVCVVAGSDRPVFMRAVLALLEDLPASVEILVSDRDGPARDAKRTLSDFSAVRYVDAPAGIDTAGAWWNVLAKNARGEHLFLIMQSTIASRHAVVQALALARDVNRAFPVVCGLVFDHAGVPIEEGREANMKLRHIEDTLHELPPPARHEHARESSGASRSALLVRRDLFESVDGCDQWTGHTALEDLVSRLAGAGVRIGFDPRLAVVDLDFTPDATRRGRHRVADRQSLDSADPGIGRQPVSTVQAKTDNGNRSLRILFVENRAPHPALGEGYPRSHHLLRAMDDAGHRIVLYPLLDAGESVPSIYRDIPRHIPVLRRLGRTRLGEFLERYARGFDLIIVARPFNMQLFRDAVSGIAGGFAALPPVVYDAEALNAAREIQRHALIGQPLSTHSADELLAGEVALAAGCAVVVAVSDIERAAFECRGVNRVFTLGHAVEPRSAPFGFNARSDFVFVGALLAPDFPNADGLRWFIDEVWPIVRGRLKSVGPLTLKIAGNVAPEVREALRGPGVELLGQVPNLDELLNRCRVFVAPTRYSAGIPLKILEAAARGVPVVARSHAAVELGWTAGLELRTGDTADAFADMCVQLYQDEAAWEATRMHASRAVEARASPAAFGRRVAEILQAATHDERLHGVLDATRPRFRLGDERLCVNDRK